jgi:hypothetical protein
VREKDRYSDHFTHEHGVQAGDHDPDAEPEGGVAVVGGGALGHRPDQDGRSRLGQPVHRGRVGQRLLLDRAADDEPDERGRRAGGVGQAEPGAVQHLDRPLDEPQQRTGPAEVGAEGEGGAVGVGEQPGAQDVGGVLEPLRPPVRVGGTGQLGDGRGEDGVGHPVQQRPLAREVPVERGCLDVQLGREPAQRQPFQAVLVEHPQRGPDHQVLVDRHG